MLQGNTDQLKHFNRRLYEKHIINSRQAASSSSVQNANDGEKIRISGEIFKVRIFVCLKNFFVSNFV